VQLILDEEAFHIVTVRERDLPLPMLHIRQPMTFVHSSITPAIGSYSMALLPSPLAFVRVPRRIRVQWSCFASAGLGSPHFATLSGLVLGPSRLFWCSFALFYLFWCSFGATTPVTGFAKCGEELRVGVRRVSIVPLPLGVVAAETRRRARTRGPD
jgi:hypothetical protein